MRFFDSNYINSSAEHLATALALYLQEDRVDVFEALVAPGLHTELMTLPASGAKLARSDARIWYVYGFQTGDCVHIAALEELRAAHNLRLAEQHRRNAYACMRKLMPKAGA